MKTFIKRLPGVSPGTRSLERHLLMWLLLPQLVLWLAAAIVTYTLASRYANQAIDTSLATASRALARQVKPIGNGLYIDFPRAAQDIIEADPDDRVSYMVSTPPGQFILGSRKLPAPPEGRPRPALGDPVFYDATMENAGASVPIRVAAVYLSYGEADTPQTMLVQVARGRATIEQLAGRILVDTALPLSALVITMSLIVWAGIRAGLAPLQRMRTLVEGRGPDDLAPIELDVAPQEVRSLAHAINTLLAAVHQSVIGQRRFISDAAHQLRTPLAGLKSQTELALDENDPQALRARLARVRESATRSAHLVSQLLTLARAEPESGAAHERSRIDLRRLAAEVCAEHVPRARALGIDLGFGDDAPDALDAGDAAASGDVGHAAPVEVNAHPLLLREALANVLDNALRYAGRGSTITMRVRRAGREAVAEIEDDGPGIAPADRQRVFERFVRATHEGDGAGLGLAIVKQIVEQHGGAVVLEGAVPRGLRLTLRLALATGAAGAAGAPGAAGVAGAAPALPGKVRMNATLSQP